jgi:hypothetical protein
VQGLLCVLLTLFLVFSSHCSGQVIVEGDAQHGTDAVDQDGDMDDFDDVDADDQGLEDPDLPEPEDAPVDAIPELPEIPGIVCGNGAVERERSATTATPWTATAATATAPCPAPRQARLSTATTGIPARTTGATRQRTPAQIH